MSEANLMQYLAVVALPLLFAITLHEVAHGWVADRLGDPTARMLGRLSLNPLKHIDPVGTVAVPLAMAIIGALTVGVPFMFGWAKPVPITVQNLRNVRRDMLWVAAAGPGANLLMALLWAALAALAIHVALPGQVWLFNVGMVGVFINILLMVLNLLPIPPLDGGRILVSLLPGPMAWRLSRIEPYGIFVLFLFLFVLDGWYYLGAAVELMSNMIKALFGLPIR